MWPLLLVDCCVITALKYLIVFFRIPHFHFARGHANYTALPENRGWQIVPVKSQIVNTLQFEGQEGTKDTM